MPLLGLPEPLPDELVRSRVVELLAQRWKTTVTTVVAGGGFGKSIALAQAIRDNAQDPTGIDLYVNLARTFGGLRGAVGAITSQLGIAADGPGDDVVAELVAALSTCSPSLVCLHLDDCHVVAGDAEAVSALATLLYRLPANARLVLAARQLPDLPLARLRAGDQLCEIGEAVLGFNDAEVALLADRYGRTPTSIARSGWPALSRLSLAAGSDAPFEFLLEEVLVSLGEPQRRALALAVIAGAADDSLLVDTGCTSRELARSVPLVSLLPDGRVVAHDLWTQCLDLMVDAPLVASLVGDVVEWLRAAGRATEAVELALGRAAWDDALAAVMDVIVHDADGLTALQCRGWLDRLPVSMDDAAEVTYLRWVADRLSHGVSQDDAQMWLAAETFRKRGEPGYEAAAMFEVAVAAWNRGDLSRFIDVAGHIERLIGEGVEWMTALATLATAMGQEMMGDVPGALEVSRSVDFGRLPSGVAELCMRHVAGLAFMLGHSAEGRELTEQLVRRRPTTHSLFLADVARFLDGDPSAVRGRWPDPVALTPGNARDEFVFGFYAAMVHACFGRQFSMPAVPSFATVREALLVTLAEVALAAGSVEDDVLAERLRPAVETIGGDAQIVSAGLALFCAYPYVLLPETRPTLDDLVLGSAFQRQWAVARALVRARGGARVEWSVLDDPAGVACSLPLAWSVELAVRAAEAGAPEGMRLAAGLIEIVGVAARDRMRAMGRRGDSLGEAAIGLLAIEAVAPSAPVWVQVIGPTLVSRPGGAAVGLRRRRVRELLCLLVLRARWRRADLCALLWPDLPDDRARANLAITLTYLRQELEPERRTGEAAFLVRQSGDQVWLHRCDALRVDVWEVIADLDRAAAMRADHRPRVAVDHLHAAARRWSGPVAPDVAHLDEMVSTLVGLERSLVDAAIEVARWRLAEGNTAEALALADRVLTTDGANEAAHALVLGAHLARGDRANARRARDRMAASLAEVGARPGDRTLMLWRRLESLEPPHV